ncbi:uncharacterized protein BT62DRAFT_1077230 [Guyanagaster necrorhizus]|uniref:Uncharacterized protein n=1 Tax=Guyanagaster necrorhizus TaxID=856835 RepID=A0A9P7VQW5_9AGAR|nr:uncharacterized protein BT62DRAFT_1077230 [Guyanagaster necrorhizus MCA 3950]KAG7445013.1 hypothetical protein BT62DRAFT_1077230 [Guyanagaster necrorhizus MCA 3950]
MESPSPSKRIIKYTYLDRQKVYIDFPQLSSLTAVQKRRGGQEHSELFSGSDNEMPLETQSNGGSRVNKGKSLMKPPSSVGTKKSEFKVPSPKQGRNDTFKPPSSSHTRKSSIGSLSRVANDEASPSTNRKPPSSVGRSAKPRSSIKPPTEREEYESDEDDNASVAESFISLSRVRRNEAERTEYFKNQPECQFIEDDSYHVKCSRCGKVVSLGTKRPFTVRPWEKHREKCDQQVPSSMLNELTDTDQPASPAIKPTQKPKSEEERKMLLESDLRAQTVRENETLCKRCQKWIRCGSQKYSLFVWNKHQITCSETSPSTRVAAVGDRIRLVNDPQVKDCGPRHADCKFCEATIQLAGDYDPTNWIAHQRTCTAPLPPPSATSESTVVAPSDGNEMRGVKRPLEETADDDTPRLNRPRKGNYRPEDQEAPSSLGWFLMPFKAFARGFKESIDNMKASGS